MTVFLFYKINSVQKNSFKVNLFWLDCVGGSSSLGWLQTRIHGSQLSLGLLSVSGVLQGLYFKYLQHVIRKLHNWQVSYDIYLNIYIKNLTLCIVGLDKCLVFTGYKTVNPFPWYKFCYGWMLPLHFYWQSFFTGFRPWTWLKKKIVSHQHLDEMHGLPSCI